MLFDLSGDYDSNNFRNCETFNITIVVVSENTKHGIP